MPLLSAGSDEANPEFCADTCHNVASETGLGQ